MKIILKIMFLRKSLYNLSWYNIIFHVTSSILPQSHFCLLYFITCCYVCHRFSIANATTTSWDFSFLWIRMRVAVSTGVTTHLRRQLPCLLRLPLYRSYVSKVDERRIRTSIESEQTWNSNKKNRYIQYITFLWKRKIILCKICEYYYKRVT